MDLDLKSHNQKIKIQSYVIVCFYESPGKSNNNKQHLATSRSSIVSLKMFPLPLLSGPLAVISFGVGPAKCFRLVHFKTNGSGNWSRWKHSMRKSYVKNQRFPDSLFSENLWTRGHMTKNPSPNYHIYVVLNVVGRFLCLKIDRNIWENVDFTTQQ